MSGTLKTLLAKLKRRRKAKAAAPHLAPDSAGDARSTLADGMANLVIADSPSITTSPANTPTAVFTFSASRDIAYSFSFSLDSPRKWPGPQYDKTSLWAPGVFDRSRASRPKAKQKSSKRKLSSEAGQLRRRSKEVPTPKPVRQREQSPRPPEYYGSPPARAQPLHLLNLPGEIRNMIYGFVCVKSDPVLAQFRPIIQRKHGSASSAKASRTIKRFPREPTLALVCRQVMNEVLPLFYRESKFVFRRSDHEHFTHLVMTQSCMMEKWYRGISARLGHIEMQFRLHTRPSGKEMISYTFCRPKGVFEVLSNESKVAVDSCTCFERKFLETLKQTVALEEADASLFLLASKTSHLRNKMQANDKTMNCTGPVPMYRPNESICNECGLITLRGIEPGI